VCCATIFGVCSNFLGLVIEVQPQLAFLFAVFLYALSSSGQNIPQSATANYPFLLHLETMDFVNQECVLLQRDGHFHLEEEKGHHTKVFEGSLPNDKLLEVQRMIDDDQLVKLTQEQIASPPGGIMLDELHVDVFRGDHWQDLSFMDVASRTPFDRSIAPLVRWLAALHKEQHRELSEDAGKNDCQLPKKVVLHSRNPATP
jgi:hypothetical protein